MLIKTYHVPMDRLYLFVGVRQTYHEVMSAWMVCMRLCEHSLIKFW